jgi:hypothetical protein
MPLDSKESDAGPDDVGDVATVGNSHVDGCESTTTGRVWGLCADGPALPTSFGSVITGSGAIRDSGIRSGSKSPRLRVSPPAGLVDGAIGVIGAGRCTMVRGNMFQYKESTRRTENKVKKGRVANETASGIAGTETAGKV